LPPVRSLCDLRLSVLLRARRKASQLRLHHRAQKKSTVTAHRYSPLLETWDFMRQLVPPGGGRVIKKESIWGARSYSNQVKKSAALPVCATFASPYDWLSRLGSEIREDEGRGSEPLTANHLWPTSPNTPPFPSRSRLHLRGSSCFRRKRGLKIRSLKTRDGSE